MAVINDLTNSDLQAGWFPDPEGLHNLRYFDGDGWTEHVTHHGPTPCPGCHQDPGAATN